MTMTITAQEALAGRESPYPSGHPCHGKPLHTHPTKSATRKCAALRKRILKAVAMSALAAVAAIAIAGVANAQSPHPPPPMPVPPCTAIAETPWHTADRGRREIVPAQFAAIASADGTLYSAVAEALESVASSTPMLAPERIALTATRYCKG